jgi:hypothetical protein
MGRSVVVLTVDGLSFPVVEAEGGPVLVAGDSELGAVAELVNEAARGAPPLRDLEERVDRHEPTGSFVMSAAPLSPAEVSDADRERWHRATGSELGGDVYRVANYLGDAPTDVALVPRETLAELFRRLKEVRLVSSETWLFRPQPLWWQPAPGEEAALRALEARAVDPIDDHPELVRELAAAGLFSGVFAEEKEAKLVDWGLRRLAAYARAGRELLEYLGSYWRQAAHGPPSADITEAPVSIELFRGLTWPSGPERDRRLAALETELGRLAPGGREGEIETVVDGRPARVRWRRRPEGQLVLTGIGPGDGPKRGRA